MDASSHLSAGLVEDGKTVSAALARSFSAVSAIPYAIIPANAAAIPKTFRPLNGLFSAKNPNANTAWS